MQDVEIPINKPARWGSLSKIILVVASLALFCLFSILWAVNSKSFASIAITYAINQVQFSEGVVFDIASISGCISNGISIPLIAIKSINDNVAIKIARVKLDFSFGTIGKKNRPEVSFSCGDIEISGFAKLAYLNRIPKIPAASCFAGLHLPVFIKQFKVAKLSMVPFHGQGLEFKADNINLSIPDINNSLQKASCKYSLKLASASLLSGSFDGSLKQAEQKLTGSLKLSVLRQKICSEISLFEKKNTFNASGFIASTTIDIAKFSQWLIPLWQDQFPFGFDGHITCKGTWAYNNKVGFLGNFSGKLLELRMVALGLFYPIFNLNVDWSLFNNAIVFKDTGSKLVGFKANLTGKIEKVFASNRNWNLDFKCNDIFADKLIAELPWAMRYSLNLPPIIGSLTFTCSVRGITPDVFAKMNTMELSVGKKVVKQFKGHLTYFSGDKQGNNVRLKYVWTANNGFPVLFDRFLSQEGMISQIPLGANKLICASDFAGVNLLHLRYSGSLKAGNALLLGSGRWTANHSSISFISDKKVIYSTAGMELFDFILAE